jgi:hypothetical protein
VSGTAVRSEHGLKSVGRLDNCVFLATEFLEGFPLVNTLCRASGCADGSLIVQNTKLWGEGDTFVASSGSTQWSMVRVDGVAITSRDLVISMEDLSTSGPTVAGIWMVGGTVDATGTKFFGNSALLRNTFGLVMTVRVSAVSPSSAPTSTPVCFLLPSVSFSPSSSIQ